MSRPNSKTAPVSVAKPFTEAVMSRSQAMPGTSVAMEKRYPHDL